MCFRSMRVLKGRTRFVRVSPFGNACSMAVTAPLVSDEHAQGFPWCVSCSQLPGGPGMPRTQSRRVAIAALAFSILLGVGTPASAQYFGRNKVQYRDFDFQVLKTEHFDIYFYPDRKSTRLNSSHRQ